VRVKDAVFKSAQKFCVIHALIAQVKGVVGEAEPFMVFHCFQRTMRRSNVESDFGRCTSMAKFTSSASKMSSIGRERFPKSSNPF
jgi:hypothetical protein